jgi:capsular exopolysaccharide synthesis family protein
MSRNFELMQQIQSERSFRTRQPSNPVFPGINEPPARTDGADWIGNEALQLVQRIFLLQVQNAPRMVVFAGVDHGDGCSQICASVAEILAKNGLGTVCLVEANFRSPALPGLFGTTNHHGLTDALMGKEPIRSYAKSVGSDKLSLLSTGALSEDSANLLTTERIKARLAELRAEFTFVIIDAPPLNLYADALAIGQLTDGIVVILKAESTRKEAARTAVSTLRAAKVEILGAVLNKRIFPIPAAIYKWL